MTDVSGVPVQDQTQRRELPAETVTAVASVAPWGFSPERRAHLTAEVLNVALADPVVAAGLLEHLLETSGYTKLSEGRSTYNGKTALPFTAEQSVYETVARQMPGITFEQRDVWRSPWTPLASSPAVSL